VQFGIAVGHSVQFVEHGRHIARHADLISLGLVGLRPRLLQFVL
jgi:hypothetical protein